MAYYEFTITITLPFRDALIRRLTNKGCLGVTEQDNFLVAYFPETIDIKAVSGDLLIWKELLLKSDRTTELTFRYSLIPDQDWNASWKEGFRPLDVGTRFTILPPWERKKEGRINLIIDPAMAFGTGHHETTRSCLWLMEKYSEEAAKERFLDLGTGSGILAIAAAHLGFRSVTGIDNDPVAVENARRNVGLNRVDADIREGTIGELDETYDFIAANLISGVLVRIAPALAAHLAPGGIAVVSGILIGQEDEVVEAMIREKLHVREKYRDGKWVSLAMGRTDDLQTP